MKSEKESSEFYERLKGQLEGDTVWPSQYLFKFIVPSKLEQIAEIEAAFDGTDAQINRRDSSKGTYTSLSVKVTMESADSVIAKYREVSNVEGVISL